MKREPASSALRRHSALAFLQQTEMILFLASPLRSGGQVMLECSRLNRQARAPQKGRAEAANPAFQAQTQGMRRRMPRR